MQTLLESHAQGPYMSYSAATKSWGVFSDTTNMWAATLSNQLGWGSHTYFKEGSRSCDYENYPMTSSRSHDHGNYHMTTSRLIIT
jgi:hypothetical protein